MDPKAALTVSIAHDPKDIAKALNRALAAVSLEDFKDRLVAIHLGTIVGHPAMIGKGPLKGKVVETGLVLAGRNPVAVDSVGAFLLGFETLGVQHLRQAEQLGLGATYMPTTGLEGEPGRLNIEGVSVDEAVKIFRLAAYGEAFQANHANFLPTRPSLTLPALRDGPVRAGSVSDGARFQTIRSVVDPTVPASEA